MRNVKADYLLPLLPCDKDKNGEKFRHASHLELLGFMGLHCFHCTRERDYFASGDAEKGCEILSRASNMQIDHPDYPAEWQYGEDGYPTCTAFISIHTEGGEGV